MIPADYESTPVTPASANSLTSNASGLIGNISWYLLSSKSPSGPAGVGASYEVGGFSENAQRLSADQQQEKFLKEVQRLQQTKAISKFTPSRSRTNSAGSLSSSGTGGGAAPSTSAYVSAHVPDGSVLQRVCDDCASALQQRRHHYNTVKVFELCEFDLQELRTLGQVCRKWHRASIMCLSMFRQIQYYLPTHRLSEREKAQLIINRKFLGGHTKWMLQLIKAIDFSREFDSDDGEASNDPETTQTNDSKTSKNRALVEEALVLMQQERKNKCMLTMCSRLCQPQLTSVDALEILADETIRDVRLRAIAVDALLKTASENEWWSYLSVLLHSLSVEPNAPESKLGQALIRQAQCDVRFCYDLYWGLTVMAEDATCRRKFDGMKQRLLLTLAQFKNNSVVATTSNPYGDPSRSDEDDITEQLLLGQEFVDLMWKLPPRIPVRDVRALFRSYAEKAGLFGDIPRRSAGNEDGPNSQRRNGGIPRLLRLPVDPLVKISGVNYKSIEVKRSAEAPMVITCTGVVREEDEDADVVALLEGTAVSPKQNRGASAMSRSLRRRTQKLPHYRLMYKRDDLRKDAIVQNIINVMYQILKQETRLDIPLVTYRVVPTSSFDGLIEIVENAHTLYSIIRDHGSIMNFLHHYNGHRTLSEISASFRESLAAYTVITFLLGVGDRHADNVMLTKDGILFHIDYGFILGKDPKPLQPPMRLDHYMIEALGGTQTQQFEQFKKLCVIAFNCLRRHVSLFMIMLTLVVKAMPEITDFDMNYTQSDLEAFVVERFLPGQSDDEAATALMLRMEGKLNERIGLKLSDFVHAHANEKTVSKGMTSVGSSVKIGVEAVEATVSTVASSLSSGASSIYKYMWGGAS